MSTPMKHLFLVRFSGELSIKGKGTRRVFVRRLAKNLVDVLRAHGIDHRLERTWSRIFFKTDDPAAGHVASRVFGISSISAVERRDWDDLDDILRHGEEIFTERVAGKVFAVRARRAIKELPFASTDVERELGSRLFPGSAGVDLTRPEIEVEVEVHPGHAFFFTERIESLSGLPLGTEDRALALVSGGYDSIVAAWLMLRRGVELDYLFCNLGGDQHRDGTLRVLKVLADRWSFGSRPRLHVVDFQPLVKELRDKTPPALWQIVLKRQMLRVAERIADELKVNALVTGEAAGQVSSQTLPNLRVISEVSHRPILRPLIGANKDEIVEQARRIGSYDLSSKVPEYCALDVRNPATKSTPRVLERGEVDLDPRAIDRQLEERAVLDLRAFDLDLSAAARDLEVDKVPEGATVLDLRSPAAFSGWHYPGATRMDYFEALKAHGGFDRDARYLLYCEIGLKSAHLAEVMRAAGFEVACFRGGLKKLIRDSEAQDPALRALMGPALLN